jgi:hypothetical protein
MEPTSLITLFIVYVKSLMFWTNLDKGEKLSLKRVF